jgi:hypothetical protein
VGIVQVVVTTSVGVSNPAAFTYVVTPAPVISSLSPTSGPQVGGTEVVINGSSLNQVTTVLVDQLSVPFTVEFNSSHTASVLSFTTPAHAPGTAPVVVTTSARASNPASFTYLITPAPQISALSPTSGPQLGGTSVVISGSNLDQATAVLVDQVSVPFTALTGKGATSLGFTTPPHAVGVAQVVVNTPAGASNPAVFTYLVTPAPHLSGLSPSSGPQVGGTRVVITGTNLNQVITVLVDRLSVPFTVLTTISGSLSFTAPPHTIGVAQVVVTTTAGTSNAAAFTYYSQ